MNKANTSAARNPEEADLRSRFRYRLKDFDLSAPPSKLDYTRKVFSVVAVRYDVITRLLSFGRDGRWKQIMLARLPKNPSPGAGSGVSA